MRMMNLKNLLVQWKLGGSAKKKKGNTPSRSSDYNLNATTSVLIFIFEKKILSFHLWFLYILYFTGVRMENIHTRNPQENQLIQG